MLDSSPIFLDSSLTPPHQISKPSHIFTFRPFPSFRHPIAPPSHLSSTTPPQHSTTPSADTPDDPNYQNYTTTMQGGPNHCSSLRVVGLCQLLNSSNAQLIRNRNPLTNHPRLHRLNFQKLKRRRASGPKFSRFTAPTLLRPTQYGNVSDTSVTDHPTAERRNSSIFEPRLTTRLRFFTSPTLNNGTGLAQHSLKRSHLYRITKRHKAATSQRANAVQTQSPTIPPQNRLFHREKGTPTTSHSSNYQ